MHLRKTSVAALGGFRGISPCLVQRSLLGLCLLGLSATPLQAGVGDYLRALRNPTPTVGDQFGGSVSAYGRRMMISKRQDDSQIREGGSTYLMAGKSGVELAHIYNPSPDKFDTFGVTNLAYGGGFLTGSWRDDNHGAVDTGAIYRLDMAGTVRQTYYNPTPNDDDRFGSAVGANDNGVIIGAYKDDQIGNDTGAVYLFNADSGQLLQTFTDPTPTPGDRFGYAVAGWGSKVIVGCYRESQLAGNSGAVYVFDSMTGALEREIFNPTPNPADYFGKALAVAGDRLIVGAPKDDTAGLDSGAAYIYDLNTGSLEASLFDPQPNTDGEFGVSLSSIGDDFLVGAPNTDRDGLVDVGTVYLFDGATGSQLAELLNPEPSNSDYFGGSLSGMVDEILISAHMDDWGATDSGSVYVFQGLADEPAMLGDINGDSAVDLSDYHIWAENFGRFVGEATLADGDLNNDGYVTGADYTAWADGWYLAHAVPEPSSFAWGASAILGLALAGWRRLAARG